MKVYRTDEIRNVVLLGHGGSGKTSLAEAMAYVSGATNRMGSVENGNTISDFDKEEQKRKFSLSTSLIPIEWEKAKINILDTPGYFDFVGEVEEAASPKGLRARWMELYVEGAVVKDNNSQNEYYTDKYADQMEIRFKNPVIEAVLLEGHKYYDANDNLVEEVPDQKLAEDEYEKIFGKFKENYIFYGGKPEADKKCYQMIVDVDEDSYIVSFYYDKVIAGWNHFLNKANMG